MQPLPLPETPAPGSRLAAYVASESALPVDPRLCTLAQAQAIAAEFGIRRDISRDLADANGYAARGKNPSDPRDGTGAAGFLRCWFEQEVYEGECDSLSHADFCRDAYGED